MSLWNASIDSLPLPTRMANVAARLGLVTVGDLARRHPAALLLEKNLGRTTVADTRVVLERAMGISPKPRAWFLTGFGVMGVCVFFMLVMEWMGMGI